MLQTTKTLARTMNSGRSGSQCAKLQSRSNFHRTLHRFSYTHSHVYCMEFHLKVVLAGCHRAKIWKPLHQGWHRLHRASYGLRPVRRNRIQRKWQALSCANANDASSMVPCIMPTTTHQRRSVFSARQSCGSARYAWWKGLKKIFQRACGTIVGSKARSVSIVKTLHANVAEFR